jgi:hypothetical protein
MSVEMLLRIVASPEGHPSVQRWLEQHDLRRWLDREREGDAITLYGSAYDRGAVFVHSILVPEVQLRTASDQALMSWSGNPFDHAYCGLVYGGGKPPRVELSAPGQSYEENFPGAQRLLHGRSFDARHGHKAYYELAQNFTLAHDLHWLDERDAWCRLDDQGDVVDLVRIHRVGTDRFERGTGISITVDREVLELHMAATGTCLVQMFDSTCTSPGFCGWTQGLDDSIFRNASDGLTFKYRLDPTNGSFFRGSHVICPPLDAQQLGAKLYAADQAPKQYATFITHDFKNRRLVEVSCTPGALASYFDKGSTLPFQTSPVFFKPGVLDKYKADPDKYRLTDRSISCRNAWSLQTYDFNEAGQVHTYITYLGDLPYDEQLYWKSYNEQPKATISRRAFKTDFEGEFDDEPDGLRSLRYALERLRESRVHWFKLREPGLLDQLNYPLTDSSKAWGNILTTLAKCAVEGLEKSYVVAQAKKCGAQGEPTWGSVKWLRLLLTSLGVEPDRLAEIVNPLVNVQKFRTVLDAHAGGEEAAKLRRQLLKEFKTPRGHIHALATEVTASLEAIAAILATAKP